MMIGAFIVTLLALCRFESGESARAEATDVPACTLHESGSTCTVVSEAAARANQIMPYVNLGRSGLLVSRLSYGAWISFGTTVDEEKAFNIMKLCLDAGINFFDNAEAYGSGVAEEIMGRALKRLEKEYPIPRSHFVLTTKIFFGTSRGVSRKRWVANQRGLSRKHIIEGTLASLARLQVDYVDVVFAHRPDDHTPMEEIVRGFNYLIDHGLAFYWCTSEWSAQQIRHAINVAERLRLVAPICEQPQYNMLHRHRMEVEYVPLFQDTGMGTTIWSALSSGILTGKYNDGIPEGSRLSQENAGYILRAFKEGTRHQEIGGWDEILERVKKLKPISERIGCTMPQLAIAWVLKNKDATTVILGATKISQIEDNLGALDCLKMLDLATMREIDDAIGNKPAPAKDWNPNPSVNNLQ